jgi:hypothetical protein
MKEKISHSTAIIGVILNAIIWPGLGTLICKKYASGIIQMILSFLFGIIVIASFFAEAGEGLAFGLVLYLVVWIWALVNSIIILKKSK